VSFLLGDACYKQAVPAVPSFYPQMDPIGVSELQTPLADIAKQIHDGVGSNQQKRKRFENLTSAPINDSPSPTNVCAMVDGKNLPQVYPGVVFRRAFMSFRPIQDEETRSSPADDYFSSKRTQDEEQSLMDSRLGIIEQPRLVRAAFPSVLEGNMQELFSLVGEIDFAKDLSECDPAQRTIRMKFRNVLIKVGYFLKRGDSKHIPDVDKENIKEFVAIWKKVVERNLREDRAYGRELNFLSCVKHSLVGIGSVFSNLSIAVDRVLAYTESESSHM